MSGDLLTEKGFTLVELVIVIVVLGILVAAGTSLFSIETSGYLESAVAEQDLAASQAAVWQLRRDYHHVLAKGASLSGCTLTLSLSGGATAVYQWSLPFLYRNSALLLDHTTSASCPFTLVQSGGRTLLNAVLVYTGASGQGNIPINVTLSSFEP